MGTPSGLGVTIASILCHDFFFPPLGGSNGHGPQGRLRQRCAKAICEARLYGGSPADPFTCPGVPYGQEINAGSVEMLLPLVYLFE